MRAKSRRPAREAALKALYQVDLGRVTADQAISDSLENKELAPDLKDFLEELVRGVIAKRVDLDSRISPLLKSWDLSRIAHIDRILLRIAAYELLFAPAIPPAVTINEAIELAKKYSTAESGRFVNGVLARLLAESPKASWDPGTAPSEEGPEPAAEPEPEPEILKEGAPRAKELKKVGPWRLRSED